MDDTKQEWLSTPQAARHIRQKPDTLAKWRKRKTVELHPVKVDGRYMYPISELNKYNAECDRLLEEELIP